MKNIYKKFTERQVRAMPMHQQVYIFKTFFYNPKRRTMHRSFRQPSARVPMNKSCTSN